MKHILLPTDFSINSYNAVSYAMQFFKNIECTFYVLNVQKQSEFILDDFMSTPSNMSLHNVIVKDNKKDLKQFIKKINSVHTTNNFYFEELFDFDNLTNAIKETIVSKNIDLIVMGTNGASGAKENLFGSNTLNVIRKIDCPVLVIPENYKYREVKSVLFSSEDCKDSNKKGLVLLKELLSHHSAFLDVLDIFSTDTPEEKTQHKQCLEYLFDEQTYDYYAIKEVSVPVATDVMSQLLHHDIHALFIAPKSNFIERFLFGFENKDISYKTRIPLLVLR